MGTLEQLLGCLGPPLELTRTGSDAVVGRWKHAGARVKVDAADAARVTMILAGTASVTKRLTDTRLERRLAAGTISVGAPGDAVDTTVAGAAHVLQILVPVGLIDERVSRADTPARSSFGTDDRILRRSAVECLVATRRGGADDGLLLDTAIHRIADRLARPSGGPQGSAPARGLAPRVRARLDDLVMARLACAAGKPLGIREMAMIAGLSVHHFIRAFRLSTGQTPYAYVSDLRIDRTLGPLAAGAMTIAEIADDCGFASPSHFVAAFRHRLGVTPGAFRTALRD